MKRFNYYRSPLERAFGLRPDALFDPRIRPSLIALILALLLIVAIAIVEQVRVGTIERETAAIELRTRANVDAVRDLTALEGRVETLRRSVRHVAQIRSTAIAGTNELTIVGDNLPRDTWLTAVRLEHGSWQIEGRSEQVSDVGAAMSALQGVAKISGARLVSISGVGRDDRILQFQLALDVTL